MAPAPALRAEPAPKQAQRAAKVRHKCLPAVVPRAGRELAWAAEMVRRAQAGERVSTYSLRLALDALVRHSLLADSRPLTQRREVAQQP